MTAREELLQMVIVKKYFLQIHEGTATGSTGIGTGIVIA